MCRKLPGISLGRLCEKCDGKCVICDSYVRPATLVRICDECNYGSYMGKCVICGNNGISDASYCKECTMQEKDRDGCPKIVNLGSSKTDLVRMHSSRGQRKGVVQEMIKQDCRNMFASERIRAGFFSRLHCCDESAVQQCWNIS